MLVLINTSLSDEQLATLRAVDPRIEVERAMRPSGPSGFVPGAGKLDDEELLPLLRRAEVLFSFRFPMEWLDEAKDLRWLQLSSAGADYIIRMGLFDKRPDLIVTTASGIHEIQISEHVLGYMLAFARNFPLTWRGQQERKWLGWGALNPGEIAGKTLGIFGYGPIARRIAMLAKTFGMRVLVARRSIAEPDNSVEQFYTDNWLREMLPQCDYFVLAAPSTPQTRHIIGADELRLMKKEAVLMNISRGALIDEPALIAALQEGVIAGAALDVFEQEPLPEASPLWAMPNVMITPHIAGASPMYNTRVVELFSANLRAYLNGEPLRNVVDPQRGY